MKIKFLNFFLITVIILLGSFLSINATNAETCAEHAADNDYINANCASTCDPSEEQLLGVFDDCLLQCCATPDFVDCYTDLGGSCSATGCNANEMEDASGNWNCNNVVPGAVCCVENLPNVDTCLDWAIERDYADAQCYSGSCYELDDLMGGSYVDLGGFCESQTFNCCATLNTDPNVGTAACQQAAQDAGAGYIDAWCSRDACPADYSTHIDNNCVDYGNCCAMNADADTSLCANYDITPGSDPYAYRCNQQNPTTHYDACVVNADNEYNYAPGTEIPNMAIESSRECHEVRHECGDISDATWEAQCGGEGGSGGGTGAGTVTHLVPNCVLTDPTTCGLCDMIQMLTDLIQFFAGGASAFGIIVFVIGGFYWIFSFGNEQRITQGKKIMTGAIVGIIIVFCAWIIINTVVLVASSGADGWGGQAQIFPSANPTNWFDVECTQ